MKSSLLLLLLLPLTGLSQSISLPDHNWTVTDISSKGLQKEVLFKEMNRNLVRNRDSICSNRAHVWAYDFKKKYGLNTAKVFLFFTAKNSTWGGASWWYHAAPVINDKNSLWVMDAGFPHRVKAPLAINDWLKEFTRESSCKEIRAHEIDLIGRIYQESAYPERTAHGTHGCYYMLAPAGYWTPGALAKNLLGHDENDRPVNFSREDFEPEEVYSACLETSTGPIGYAMRSGRKRCAYFLENGVF